MAFFGILSISDTPLIFLELSKYVFKIFLAQLGPILEGGGASDAPPPKESRRKLGPQK